jgi:acyl-CoA synthetase (NDP forming)
MEIDHLKKHYDIPIFNAPENAMRAFDLSRKWFSSRRGPAAEAAALSGGAEGLDREAVQAILDQGRSRGALLLSEGLDLLAAAGVPLPPHRLAGTPEDAEAAWRAVGGRAAMKLNRPHLNHKTDLGGVRLDLRDEEAVRRAFASMQETAGRDDVEVLVQAMAPGGLEVILGGKRDAVFGPVVMFGLGGVLVEAFGDAVWRVAPVGPDEAFRMTGRIRGRRLLEGLRVGPPRDVAALQDLVVRLSRLLDAFPAIREMDVNPVVVQEAGNGALAVDARIILDGEPPR